MTYLQQIEKRIKEIKDSAKKHPMSLREWNELMNLGFEKSEILTKNHWLKNAE